jgi:hypothetical protein
MESSWQWQQTSTTIVGLEGLDCKRWWVLGHSSPLAALLHLEENSKSSGLSLDDNTCTTMFYQRMNVIPITKL